MTTLKISQTGNRIELSGGNRSISYAIAGVDLPELTDMSFAVWHMLPLAMKSGTDLHVDGPVDPLTCENAERMARTWELWRPQDFGAVKVTALPGGSRRTGRGEDLVMFSGGVDSTYMLLERGRRPEPAAALTVQGMEYGHGADAQFQRSLRHSQPLLDALNYRRITVTSDLRQSVKGYHTYASVIAGYAFLFGDLFKAGLFAADLSWEQDLLLFPWSLNHVTNRYFISGDFACRALNDDVTRAQKVEAIAGSPVALSSVSFCIDKSIRPQNCGRCRKCVRTKAMFAGLTGAVPEGVFLDPGPPRITRADMLGDERAFIFDLYQRIRERGRLDAVPGLQEAVDGFLARSRWQRRWDRLLKRRPR
ncbi:hypothetical protein D1122_03405 [Cereibacter sphaeroides]|uniref:hypothetical protein n=1 Tax=Cereibacter sphaeroides TaxID=1063 RepID=UPI000E5C3866|nr:hypothetical protein [Cereibacter sphaeroides]RIA00708.1 hypothetical protein D1122_03405 [Cereibacter sphaeroides]